MTKRRTRRTKILSARQKKNLKRKIYGYGALLILTLALGALSYLSFDPRLAVLKINAKSQDYLSKQIKLELYNETKTSYDGFISKQIMPLIDKRKLSANVLRKFPELKDIYIQKRYGLQALEFDIAKREKDFIVCKSDVAEIPSYKNCFFTDKDGFVFKEADKLKNKEMLLKVLTPENIRPGLWLDVDKLKNIKSIKKARSQMENNINFVFFDNKGNIYIYFNKNYIILRIDNFDTQLNNFLQIKKEYLNNLKNIDYVDLRFDKKIFYKEKK